jgi:hypothetical protein
LTSSNLEYKQLKGERHMTSPYRPQPPPDPDDPAQTLVAALQRAQDQLQPHRPEGCRIVATALLTTGQELDIISAHAASPDLIVFMAIRDKKTITAVIRYAVIAQCTFHFEKGEPRSVEFYPESEPMGFRLR